MPTQEQLQAALATVEDPEIRRPITEMGMVKSASVDEAGVARIGVYLTICSSASSTRSARSRA